MSFGAGAARLVGADTVVGSYKTNSLLQSIVFSTDCRLTGLARDCEMDSPLRENRLSTRGHQVFIDEVDPFTGGHLAKAWPIIVLRNGSLFSIFASSASFHSTHMSYGTMNGHLTIALVTDDKTFHETKSP